MSKINKLQINYSNFFFSFCLSKTGTKEIRAKRLNTVTDVHDQASLVEVKVCKVWPACIATKDGGATPITNQKFDVKL